MLTAYQFALIVAAPIAAALAIFGVVVVRGTKISEFRQAWINGQRDDLATLVSNARRILRAVPGDEIAEAWASFDLAISRIRLRRNPRVRLVRRLFAANRVEWLDVLPELETLETALNEVPVNKAVAEKAIEQTVLLSAPHLKREWNRTRDGEIGFRIFIIVAPLLIGGTLLVAIGWVLDRALGLNWLGDMPFLDTLPVPPPKEG